MRLDAKNAWRIFARRLKRILQFTAGKSFADYEADALLRSAVERQFEIIGEAVSRISKVDRALVDILPEAPRIIAFRNILIHSYDIIENGVVWDVVQHNLMPLHTQVCSLLINSD